MKTLAVIIPMYLPDEATVELARTCLDALHQPDDRFLTVVRVVDDGSPMAVPHRMSDADELYRIRYSSHDRNRGIAVAWNTGWQAEKDADFFCWLNADCEVTKGWAFPLLSAAEQLGCIAMPYTNGEKWRGHGITGWCFLASRETANRIGPFDETFVPARYEDVDWMHRAIYQHQIAIANVPASNVIHEERRGGTAAIPRMELLHTANRFRYAWKHNLDPNLPPPFWRVPLPDVEMEE